MIRSRRAGLPVQQPVRRTGRAHVALSDTSAVPRRETEEAVAQVAPIAAALAAAGASEAVPQDDQAQPAGARSAQPASASASGSGSTDPIAGELRRAGIVQLLVLELLGAAPSYGNRLIEGIAELSGGLLAVNPNTMYPLLRQLEDRGLIKGSWEHPERRSRRFYALTEDGGRERERLRGEVAPRLEAVAAAVDGLRRSLERP